MVLAPPRLPYFFARKKIETKETRSIVDIVSSKAVEHRVTITRGFLIVYQSKAVLSVLFMSLLLTGNPQQIDKTTRQDIFAAFPAAMLYQPKKTTYSVEVEEIQGYVSRDFEGKERGQRLAGYKITTPKKEQFKLLVTKDSKARPHQYFTKNVELKGLPVEYDGKKYFVVLFMRPLTIFNNAQTFPKTGRQ